MPDRTSLVSYVISAATATAAALATCLLFFYFVYLPSQKVETAPFVTPSQMPVPTPIQEPPIPEVKAADVNSVTIDTVYKGYFDAGSKCAKSYNEYFGDQDGIFSSSSPCNIRMSFGRDGHAVRSIVISRWDKSAKGKRVVEKTDSTADVTPEQFNTLAQAIVSNQAFRSWREGTMISASNCSITVAHTGGAKTIMSNVDERTTVFLQMVDAIRQTEHQLDWKSVQ